jgi:glycosyltransferase involved in cell wall biosynthesis
VAAISSGLQETGGALSSAAKPVSDRCELSIIMPCLNEAETLVACIEKAQRGLRDAGVDGEVLIADNGSTDGSLQLAEAHGARVVHVAAKGYGNALRGGIEAARGKWLIMGDADDSYDFSNISGFVAKLREGYEVVMGCRLPSGGGTIAPGAMPWKNRWIGNPSLSFIGRLFFQTPVRDFHCGLRALTKEAYERMQLQTTGMEFASEMVMKASIGGMKMTEVPITLHPDGRSRPPHLRPWRDGWRHLRFMLIYSPRWLFLVPGIVLAAIGAIVSVAICSSDLYLGKLHLDAGSLAVACAAMIVGVQLVAFAAFTKVFAIAEGLLPPDPRISGALKTLTLERGLVFGVLLLLAGFGLLGYSLMRWSEVGFGDLSYPENLRRVITSSALLVLGMQVIFSSFFLSVLGLKTGHRKPPEPAA